MRNNTRVAFYYRVSTASQTTENQRHDLVRVASMRNWTVVETFQDEGISGTKHRSERPALDALLKGATKGDFDLVAVWAIDRLGRSLQHLVETVNELRAVDVDLYVHQQAIDTSTPAGKLAFSVFGALAEYERELIRERVRVGLDRAKRNGVRLGRPSNLNDAVRAGIIESRGRHTPIEGIAKRFRVGTGTVYKVLAAGQTIAPLAQRATVEPP